MAESQLESFNQIGHKALIYSNKNAIKVSVYRHLEHYGTTRSFQGQNSERNEDSATLPALISTILSICLIYKNSINYLQNTELYANFGAFVVMENHPAARQ